MTTSTHKTCSKCEVEKPTSLFSKGRSHGYHVWCKDCLSLYARSIKERKGPAFYREQGYQRKYGMSIADVENLLHKQGGGCAICETQITFSPGFSKSAHVDHCHTTGQVRGILCGNCNTALGKLGDSHASIRRVLNYLEQT